VKPISSAVPSVKTQNMTMTLEEYNKKRGRIVPYVIIAFFISFMTPVIGFAVLALKNAPSEVTTNAYEKGVAYNQIIEAEAAQKALGWEISHKVNPDPIHGPILEISVTDKQGIGIDGLLGQARFIHPAKAGLDQQKQLKGGKNGNYSLALKDVKSGQWMVHITLAKGNDQTQKRLSLVL
jgi:nitrogen fixation protein FixH